MDVERRQIDRFDRRKWNEQLGCSGARTAGRSNLRLPPGGFSVWMSGARSASNKEYQGDQQISGPFFTSIGGRYQDIRQFLDCSIWAQPTTFSDGLLGGDLFIGTWIYFSGLLVKPKADHQARSSFALCPRSVHSNAFVKIYATTHRFRLSSLCAGRVSELSVL